MKAPRAVTVGATVGVFAPSSPFPADRFDAGVRAIEALGLRVQVPELARRATGYLAGTDDERIKLVHTLLDDPEIDVLWAARGGYGLHRIVDLIDPAKIARANKPIVGFSDICALHALAQAGADLESLHGPVVTQLGALDAAHGALLLRLLAGEREGIEYRAEATVHGGRAEGRLLGGCLSVIAPMIGSELLPDFDGAILLLEDVGEATYRVDRMLTQLHLAGVLDRVAGVGVGELVDVKPRRDGEWSAEEVLADRLGGLGVPVVRGLPFGHGAKNLPLPLGARAALDADARTLTLLAP